MSYGLYISAEGAHAQEFRMRVIANNIANIETPGFKREMAMQQARHTERILLGNDWPGSGTINDVGGGVKTIGTHTEFNKLGSVQHTGIRTDVCIAEKTGWFLVQDMQSGENFLTRAGNFQILADGTLVAQSGTTRFAVLAENGDRIRIDNSPDNHWTIIEDGTIYDPAGGENQRLALVRPNVLHNMLKMSQNVYRSLDGYVPLENLDRNVRQFMLEGSSVDAASEMVEMIVTSRALESNTKLMQIQDEMSGGLIARVLRVV